jgi:hypothetical protein
MFSAHSGKRLRISMGPTNDFLENAGFLNFRCFGFHDIKYIEIKLSASQTQMFDKVGASVMAWPWIVFITSWEYSNISAVSHQQGFQLSGM